MCLVHLIFKAMCVREFLPIPFPVGRGGGDSGAADCVNWLASPPQRGRAVFMHLYQPFTFPLGAVLTVVLSSYCSPLLPLPLSAEHGTTVVFRQRRAEGPEEEERVISYFVPSLYPLPYLFIPLRKKWGAKGGLPESKVGAGAIFGYSCRGKAIPKWAQYCGGAPL